MKSDTSSSFIILIVSIFFIGEYFATQQPPSVSTRVTSHGRFTLAFIICSKSVLGTIIVCFDIRLSNSVLFWSNKIRANVSRMICSAVLGLTVTSFCLFVSVVMITSLAYIFCGSFTGVVVTWTCSGPGFEEPCSSAVSSSISLSLISLVNTLFSDTEDALKLSCCGVLVSLFAFFFFTSLI